MEEGAKRRIRVLVAAGGTGGHIIPALAVARLLRERARDTARPVIANEIIFLGTGRALEARLITEFPLRTAPAAGLKGIRGARLLRNLLLLPRSGMRVAAVLKEVRPDVVVGMGGYAAGPVMLIASLKKIPALLIEPNALPGFTNRVLRPFVRIAAVGFEEAARFYGAKARWTGHPVRKEFFEVPAKPHRAPFTVVVIGGSQGAHAINEAVAKSLPLLSSQPLSFIHQTGEADYNAVRAAYGSAGVAAEVHAFIEDVPAAFARADLVVGRAGAMSVAEIAAAGRAALLVPFPGAADQHQMANALAFERAGAARVLPQADLTPERLAGEILDLLGNANRLRQMEDRAKSLTRPGAAGEIADCVEELVR